MSGYVVDKSGKPYEIVEGAFVDPIFLSKESAARLKEEVSKKLYNSAVDDAKRKCPEGYNGVREVRVKRSDPAHFVLEVEPLLVHEAYKPKSR
ncbi:MAG: hypothetical protein HYU39_03185 [Thaumarchaeota archaeon]|nr:hypothetical protein [Nitrososphaerota archaeon]